ncbi:MAG: hypothetical protein MK074_01420 [Phycisphaerales bacterium]|nr:hypothetical protein [Phycisphaerales bacterium]
MTGVGQMLEGAGTLCSDVFVNQRLALTMDLPSRRETVLDLFDRMRKSCPGLTALRRYDGEYALESEGDPRRASWVSLRRTSVRSGMVNPQDLSEPYDLHRSVLRTAPYYLSITPLDVECIDLVFGFDLAAHGNHDEAVFETFLDHSPLAGLVRDGDVLCDVQPLMAFHIEGDPSTTAVIEVRTKQTPGTDARSGAPVSVFLTVRRRGPFSSLDQFDEVFGSLAGWAERIAEDRVIPQVVAPLHQRLLLG